MPRFGGRRLSAKKAIDTFRGLPVPNPTDCRLVARIEVKSVAPHKYTLLLGQRSRPLAFAGSSLLRSSPQKKQTAATGGHPTHRARRQATSRSGAVNLGTKTKTARMFFSRIGRLWQHKALQNHSRSSQCGLTPRSRRGPTSKRQARAVGWRIFHRTGLAFCCRSRLSSNVRHHKRGLWHLRQEVRRGAPRASSHGAA